MKCIKLRDVKVSRIGLGAMGMSHGCTGSGGRRHRSHSRYQAGVRVEENTAADAVELTAGQLAGLSSLPPAAGDTHTEAQQQMRER